MGWRRIKQQEDSAVFRWFENKGIIASVVESNRFSNAKEIRISGKVNGKWFDPMIIPISNSIAQRKSDKEYISTINMHLKRKGIFLTSGSRKKSHVADLKRDRMIKAKTVRKMGQPTWTGDLKGERI